MQASGERVTLTWNTAVIEHTIVRSVRKGLFNKSTAWSKRRNMRTEVPCHVNCYKVSKPATFKTLCMKSWV